MTRKELRCKSRFLLCTKSFQDFIKGKYYWLEVINNTNDDMYCVRSDNLLGRYYQFSEEELVLNFKEDDYGGNKEIL